MKKIIPLIMALTLSNVFAKNLPEINTKQDSRVIITANDYPSHRNEITQTSENKDYEVNIFVDNEQINSKTLIIKPNQEFYTSYFSNNLKNEIFKDIKYETKSYIIMQDNHNVTLFLKIITTIGNENSVVCHTTNKCTVITPFKSIKEIKVENFAVKNNHIDLYFTQVKNSLNLEVK